MPEITPQRPSPMRPMIQQSRAEKCAAAVFDLPDEDQDLIWEKIKKIYGPDLDQARTEYQKAIPQYINHTRGHLDSFIRYFKGSVPSKLSVAELDQMIPYKALGDPELFTQDRKNRDRDKNNQMTSRICHPILMLEEDTSKLIGIIFRFIEFGVMYKIIVEPDEYKRIVIPLTVSRYFENPASHLDNIRDYVCRTGFDLMVIMSTVYHRQHLDEIAGGRPVTTANNIYWWPTDLDDQTDYWIEVDGEDNELSEDTDPELLQ